MNSQYRNETDFDDLTSPLETSREISFGTTTIVGIFLALALVCGAFFGFGYSLGRRSAQPATAATPTDEGVTLSSNGAKPAPGSRAAASSKPDHEADSDSEPSPEQPSTAPAATAKTVSLDSETASSTERAATSPVRPVPAARSVQVPAPMPTTAAVAIGTPGTAIVQVAAVSHQDDADVLLTALKRRGYSVAIHHEPQDKLLHVQIGPFASKKEAEAMRQRLLGDGYNAIVK